jgi:protein-S-isoprenylcysteine O-methyltransferase
MAATSASNTGSAAADARTSRSIRSQSSASEAFSDAESFTFDDLRPGEKLSQTGISLQAYILGITLGAGAAFSLQYAIFEPRQYWRVFFFPGVLSLFHFCEFYTYARWNLKNTTIDSYLTLSNGTAYMSAMTFAWLETTITSIWFPEWQNHWAKLWIQAIGAVLLIGGQLTRHISIATAGTSFNHHVQQKRRNDHVLITRGPYSWTRHPSYFGFYWWALGTQLLLGNAIATPVFAVVLWRFFFHRIPSEFEILSTPCLTRLDQTHGDAVTQVIGNALSLSEKSLF